MHKLRASEKQVFLNSLIRLAGKHARLPESITITGEIDFSRFGNLSISGGFADIQPGIYEGSVVAVKALRVMKTDNVEKIKKVHEGG